MWIPTRPVRIMLSSFLDHVATDGQGLSLIDGEFVWLPYQIDYWLRSGVEFDPCLALLGEGRVYAAVSNLPCDDPAERQ